jgi:ubiquitin-like modifier-activating enzyme ATG7
MEKNKSKKVDLGFLLNPIKLSESSVSLNLELMKWRMFTSLDTEKLSKIKCLLLGSGTLGCSISRILLSWVFFFFFF